MKKILFGMLAAAAVLFTSCSQDDFQPALNGDEATVTINLTTPQIASRAYSDGTTATHLQYALYDVSSGTAKRLDKYTVTNDEINISKNISFKLVNGHTYRFVFWASAPNADGPYSVEFADDAATFSIDYENYADFFKANLEDLDAFFVCEDLKVTGDVQKTFELRRPFAQINVGTSDYDDAAEVDYVPALSKMVVKNLYSTLDLFTGKASDEVEMTYNYNVINRNEQFPVSGHEYMSMVYALVDKGEASLVTVAFSYKEGENTQEETRTFGSVPVQRNYRTNIFGSLLTNDVDVNIIIIPEYETPDYIVNGALVNSAAEASAAASKGEDVIMESDIINPELTENAYGKNWAAIKQNGGTINGAGNTLNVGAYSKDGTETYGIYTTGGTIKNLTITNAFRSIMVAENVQEDLYIDNCVVKGAYTINTAGSTYNYAMHVTNSELYGWTTWSAFTNATFDNCKFLPSVAWPNTKEYWLCRAYVNTTFTNCDFDKDYTISLNPLSDDTIFEFNNCTVGGQPLTRDNINWEFVFYKVATEQGKKVDVHYTDSHKINFKINGVLYTETCPGLAEGDGAHTH